MHRFHHQVQGWVDNRPGLFWIEAFNQGGGAFEVGKQRREGLTLPVGGATPLHRRLLSEDALSQVLGGVARWGLRMWSRVLREGRGGALLSPDEQLPVFIEG